MNKIKINKIDETIYHEKLDNGLNIYIYKKEGYVKKGAYFVTNYGSATNDFKPIGEDEIKSFPKGIAHFLEHKLFESEDNEKVFDKFKKYGANVNAYTNHNVTNYYFSTVEHFEECLNLLIDFVQSPYFTDQNVEKEKGIINQEINMTSDDVDRFMFEELFNSALNVNPNKYKTIGDKKNVGMITKEDLYRCYNTFYHPSNMILVIYGDVDVNKTIELVKNNQSSKKFMQMKEIEIKEFDEDEKVSKSYAVFNRNVSVPRVGICYKLKVPMLDGYERYEKSLLINLMLEMKFGGTSSFEKDLLKSNIIENELSWTYSYFDDIILIFLETSTNKKNEFIEIVDKKIKEVDFKENIFELNKKAYITSMVRAYENPSAVGSVIFNQVFKYKEILSDAYNTYSKYSFDMYVNEFKKLNFNNKSVIYITSKED